MVGRVAEWLKAPDSKSDVRATVPWVRIPPLPPPFCHIFARSEIAKGYVDFVFANYVNVRPTRRRCSFLLFCAGHTASRWLLWLGDFCQREHGGRLCRVAPPLGGSDRQAAHYYRAQYARARQREERCQQRAQTAEKIIVQLQVLIGWLLQQIRVSNDNWPG